MNNRRRIVLLRAKWVLFSLVVLQVAVIAQQLKIVFISPSFNEIALNIRPQIAATFNQPVDPSTLTIINFAVMGERSGYVNGIISYDSAQNKAIFSPSKNFIAGERVTVALARGIRASAGDSLKGFSWSFRVPSKNVGINFSNPVSYDDGGYGMQCTDMNNDGSPDIITSSGVILLNNGNGQFNSSWTLPDADGWGQIVADDFNRDGKMDVVFDGGNGLKIGIGDGTGNFAISTRPFWFAHYTTADLNNDGYSDMIGILPSKLVIAFNSGDGQFTDSIQVGSLDGFLTDLSTADIDNDGDLDVIVISNHNVNADSIYGFEGIIVFKNSGTGKFSKPNFYQPYVVNYAFPKHVLVADFNNDGYSDVAVMGDMAGYVCLNLKNGALGTDTSSVRKFWGAEQISPFTCGDINGDGWIDIAKSGYTIPFELYPRFYAVVANCNSKFYNCSSRNYFRDTLPNALVHAVATADLDADGDMDLVHAGEGVFITLNGDTVTSVNDDFEQPKDFSLHQNYPNPFNPSTTIEFKIPNEKHVTLVVYNILGEQIRNLFEGNMSPGLHHVVWDGKNIFGVHVGSGVFFYQIKTDDFIETKKMMLLR